MNSIVLWMPAEVEFAVLETVVRSITPYEGERVYLRPETIESDYTADELAAIRVEGATLRPWVVDYSGGILVCKEIGLRLAAAWPMVLDTDFSPPMTGESFIRRVVGSSNWDWRADEVVHDWTSVES